MTTPSFKRIPADTTLRDKIGTGHRLDATIIPAMQHAARQTKGDVSTLIKQHLVAIKETLAQAASTTYGREEYLPTLSRHIMDIKSLGGMFGFPTISAPADVLLAQIDENTRLDDDLMEIISGFIRLSVRQLSDEKQETYEAQKLATSMAEACKRYQDKANKNSGR